MDFFGKVVENGFWSNFFSTVEKVAPESMFDDFPKKVQISSGLQKNVFDVFLWFMVQNNSIFYEKFKNQHLGNI